MSDLHGFVCYLRCAKPKQQSLQRDIFSKEPTYTIGVCVLSLVMLSSYIMQAQH